jgi:hypothetical protein
MADAFRDAHARLEQALAGALEMVAEVGTPAEIERLIRLLIKHKIVTEMLLDVIGTEAAYGQAASITKPSNQPLPLAPSNPTEDSGSTHAPEVDEDVGSSRPAPEISEKVGGTSNAPDIADGVVEEL